MKSPTEPSAAVWFSPLTEPARACSPEKALFHCEAAAWFATGSATWQRLHCVATLIAPPSQKGVVCPPWQLTFAQAAAAGSPRP